MGVLDKLKNTFGIDEEDEDELDYEDEEVEETPAENTFKADFLGMLLLHSLREKEVFQLPHWVLGCRLFLLNRKDMKRPVTLQTASMQKRLLF